MSSAEYLPTGTDTSLIVAGRIVADGCSYFDYSKEGTTIRTTVVTEATGGYLELPLNYYKYYTCRDCETGEVFTVGPGYNNTVKVTLPGNYTGEILVSFREPWFWRLSEILSGVSLIALLLGMAMSSRRKMPPTD